MQDIEPILDQLGFDETTWWAGIKLYGNRPGIDLDGIDLDRRDLEIKSPRYCWIFFLLCGLREMDDTRNGSKLLFEVVFVQSEDKLSIAAERHPRC